MSLPSLVVPPSTLILAEAGFSDIREIVRFPNYWPWLLTAAMLLALATCIAWWRWKKNQSDAVPEPIEPPHLKALRLLRALQDGGDGMEAEQFTIEVSAILRRYLEDALDLPAPEQTSEEFLQDLRHQPWLTAQLQQDLEEFMRLADLVKFARQSLDAKQRQRLLESAVQVVDTTKPEPEPAVR